MNKKIVIFGGGTVSHLRAHLALCAPAYGTVARKLKSICQEVLPLMDVELKMTKMAGGDHLETNEDIDKEISKIREDKNVKIVIMTAALCDFYGTINGVNAKYEEGRLDSSKHYTAELYPSEKIIRKIRKEPRKDIFLIGFKTTCGASLTEQYSAGLSLLKNASCNLVLCNDIDNGSHIIVVPEESYYTAKNRDAALRMLMDMAFYRSQLTFTRSTVVDGSLINWDSPQIPNSLRVVVDYCIKHNGYKVVNGSTAGHFACKLSDNTFLTSIRKVDFNKLADIGLVKIVTDGPDNIIAYGAKPSVGGQSQRIIFSEKKDVDCIVHFHCPRKGESLVPIVSQLEYECGSHECGRNTLNGLKKFKVPSGEIYAVYLNKHGPNIVFNKNIDPLDVITFIEENFELSKKTDYVNIL